MNVEKQPAKDFNFEIPFVDRERGHVFLLYGDTTYKWFLRPDGRALALLNADERDLDTPVLQAMKKQVWAILKPALDSHNLKNLRP